MTETLLIISFSRLTQDARLRRQIALFADRYRVVTAGFGPAVEGAAQHFELPEPPGAGIRRRIRAYSEAILLRLHAYRLMYWTDPTVRAARQRLRRQKPDRLIANDIYTVPLGFGLVPADRVLADLHEFYPGLHDDSAAWVRLRKPYYEWLVRSAARAGSATTVGAGLADAYAAYGVQTAIVTNAPVYEERTPTPVHSPIRIVHAGAALPTRKLERMMRAVAASSADVRLTVHLAPNNPAYVDTLRRLADELGDRVSVEPPVPQQDLIDMLAQHDVGIHVLPPIVTNQALALPNKLFDFVQARIGLIVGPTPGMAAVVRESAVGAVTSGFEEGDIRATIDALDASTVLAWKQAAAAAAHGLSAETQLPIWLDAVSRLGRPR